MQTGVAKGLKVPCLFMITEVSIRCQKTPEVGIRRIPAYTPQYTTGYGHDPYSCKKSGSEVSWFKKTRSVNCGTDVAKCSTLPANAAGNTESAAEHTHGAPEMSSCEQ